MWGVRVADFFHNVIILKCDPKTLYTSFLTNSQSPLHQQENCESFFNPRNTGGRSDNSTANQRRTQIVLSVVYRSMLEGTQGAA